jgi:hypothetical protein
MKLRDRPMKCELSDLSNKMLTYATKESMERARILIDECCTTEKFNLLKKDYKQEIKAL